jgi:hypothetical protein
MFNTVSDTVSLVKTIPTVTSANYFRFMMSGVRHEPKAAVLTNLGSSFYFLRRFDKAINPQGATIMGLMGQLLSKYWAN